MCNTEQKTEGCIYMLVFICRTYVTKIKRYEFEMEQGDMGGTGRRMIIF